MKRFLCAIAAVAWGLTLISWGTTGHKAVAQIADNHLSVQARQGIQKLLGHQTLADVSNWADELRADPQYKYTGEWHYADVPAGLTFSQFAAAIKTMPQSNVYKMMLRCMADIKSSSTTKTQKTEALKFLIHFTGDLHQPMHVAHAEDRGGNNISVSFLGYNYNLHALWDSGLMEHENLSYKQMAATYDTAGPAEIDKWQNDDLMVWLWESYQISSILYTEATENPDFNDTYYQEHLPVLQKRIEKAGIRLAGLLNKIF